MGAGPFWLVQRGPERRVMMGAKVGIFFLDGGLDGWWQCPFWKMEGQKEKRRVDEWAASGRPAGSEKEQQPKRYPRRKSITCGKMQQIE